MTFCSIHPKAILQQEPKLLFRIMNLRIIPIQPYITWINAFTHSNRCPNVSCLTPGPICVIQEAKMCWTSTPFQYKDCPWIAVSIIIKCMCMCKFCRNCSDLDGRNWILSNLKCDEKIFGKWVHYVMFCIFVVILHFLSRFVSSTTWGSPGFFAFTWKVVRFSQCQSNNPHGYIN